MTLRIGEKKTVEILMMIPEKDKCNGVILGYVVYFSERNYGHLPHKEYNKTVPRNDSIDGSTKATIEGLKAFMWYQFEAVAFTSGGEGNRTNQFIYILTLEDGKCFYLVSLEYFITSSGHYYITLKEWKIITLF